jgi:hypothetical protein
MTIYTIDNGYESENCGEWPISAILKVVTTTLRSFAIFWYTFTVGIKVESHMFALSPKSVHIQQKPNNLPARRQGSNKN